MARFVILDCEGNMVEIRAEEIGEILSMAYYGDYEGENTIENFINWFTSGCQDDEDDEDED